MVTQCAWYVNLQSNKDVDGSKCGETNWRAAGNTLRKKKNLSETGLEIAGCRHAIAQKAVNMIYGEITVYLSTFLS